MLSSQADLKDLSDWMELDYFRRSRPLARWRRRLAWGGLAAGAVLGALLLLPPFVGPRAVQPIYQSRPVSVAHAMFNDDCAKCHTESFRTLGRLAHGDDFRSVEDQTCVRCHEGPLHHPQQTFAPDCAACHREHLGRPQLARVNDAHCTLCHADLKVRKGDPKYDVQIDSFPDAHPEFGRWWKEAGLDDPGTVRFNHAVHLREEGVLEPAPGGPPDVEPKRRKLDCAACHRLDAAGRYVLPVNYDSHCKACHPLWVSVTGEAKDDKVRRAAEAFAREPAPHREPDLVRAVLRQRYTDFALAHRTDAEPLAPQVPEPPLPGPRRPQAVTEEQGTWIGRELAGAEKALFDAKSGCAYCHTRAGLPGSTGLPRFELSAMPARWFPHSRFDHSAHRMLACAACHGDVPKSKRTADVLMPGKDACVNCHSPAGGARHDCAECHTYHRK